MTGGEEFTEKPLLFWIQRAGFDLLAVVLYPVQDATVFYLLLVGKVVKLVYVSFELTEIPIPNLIASGEHISHQRLSGVFLRFEIPEQVRNDRAFFRRRKCSDVGDIIFQKLRQQQT